MSRPIHEIAVEIKRDWQRPNAAALPYLTAMESLATLDDNYGADSGKEIVIRFLAHASTWQGDIARRIKTELKAMLDAS